MSAREQPQAIRCDSLRLSVIFDYGIPQPAFFTRSICSVAPPNRVITCRKLLQSLAKSLWRGFSLDHIKILCITGKLKKFYRQSLRGAIYSKSCPLIWHYSKRSLVLSLCVDNLRRAPFCCMLRRITSRRTWPSASAGADSDP